MSFLHKMPENTEEYAKIEYSYSLFIHKIFWNAVL